MENETNQLPIVEQKESIKLVKNSRGYNWEIKLISDDISNELERLEKIDKKMDDKYGDSLE